MTQQHCMAAGSTTFATQQPLPPGIRLPRVLARLSKCNPGAGALHTSSPAAHLRRQQPLQPALRLLLNPKECHTGLAQQQVSSQLSPPAPPAAASAGPAAPPGCWPPCPPLPPPPASSEVGLRFRQLRQAVSEGCSSYCKWLSGFQGVVAAGGVIRTSLQQQHVETAGCWRPKAAQLGHKAAP